MSVGLSVDGWLMAAGATAFTGGTAARGLITGAAATRDSRSTAAPCAAIGLTTSFWVGSVLTAGGGVKDGSVAGAAVTGDTGAASWAKATEAPPISAAMMAVLPTMRIDCALVIFNLLSVWTEAQRFVADNWSALCGLRGVISVEPSRK